jgi:DNA polymerase III subunit delta'
VSPSRARTADAAEAPHPREAQQLFGHSEAEQELLQAYRSGRMPHAWLIGGPEGIGKATLAYRMARFVLAHPDPDGEAVKAAQSLTVPPDHSAARHIVAQAHSDLLTLERTVGDNGKLRTEIAVADVRRTISFFGSTAGAGGWRVCIVDSVDELNRFGTNALLKILEEPPAKSLLLLVSHVPGQVLPTIRSRCRRLLLRPLHPDDVVRAATTALGMAGEDNELRHAAALADGSVARALALFDGPTLALHDGVAALLARLPEIDPSALHVIGDSLGRANDGAFETFLAAIREWLSTRLAYEKDSARLARIAMAWETFNQVAADVAVFNLERKPLVFSTFDLLAGLSRA